MGIPDETYFGENLDGKGILYGEVRQISCDQDKLALTKNRLDVLFVEQNNRIAERDGNQKPKIWSPFSVCVLTLLGIETLGYVIQDIEKIKEEGDFEKSKKIVTPIYQLLDKGLIVKPTKKFFKGFRAIHGDKAKKKVNRYSDIFHKFQRNTFNHGFQAKGVFLSHELTEFWTIEEEKGFLIVNPYLFWDRFVKVYEETFKEISENEQSPWRKNALTYFDRLIN